MRQQPHASQQQCYYSYQLGHYQCLQQTNDFVFSTREGCGHLVNLIGPCLWFILFANKAATHHFLPSRLFGWSQLPFLPSFFMTNETCLSVLSSLESCSVVICRCMQGNVWHFQADIAQAVPSQTTATMDVLGASRQS